MPASAAEQGHDLAGRRRRSARAPSAPRASRWRPSRVKASRVRREVQRGGRGRSPMVTVVAASGRHAGELPRGPAAKSVSGGMLRRARAWRGPPRSTPSAVAVGEGGAVAGQDGVGEAGDVPGRQFARRPGRGSARGVGQAPSQTSVMATRRPIVADQERRAFDVAQRWRTPSGRVTTRSAAPSCQPARVKAISRVQPPSGDGRTAAARRSAARWPWAETVRSTAVGAGGADSGSTSRQARRSGRRDRAHRSAPSVGDDRGTVYHSTTWPDRGHAPNVTPSAGRRLARGAIDDVICPRIVVEASGSSSSRWDHGPVPVHRRAAPAARVLQRAHRAVGRARAAVRPAPRGRRRRRSAWSAPRCGWRGSWA